MKILVYDDNPDYGGHQVMACHGLEALAADPALEVLFMRNPQNKRLAVRTAAIKNIRHLTAPFTTRKLQGLRNLVSRNDIAALAKIFTAVEADLVLCIQGDIEDSSQALLAARKAKIACVSYLAIPHPMQHMGAKLGKLRDGINRYLLNKPDRYIVIGESMQKMLAGRGVKKPIEIVHNGIPTPMPQRYQPFKQGKTTIGMLGRIEFNQKRQDFMVDTFCAFADAFSGCHLLIAGDGPDETKLRKQIAGNENITLMPWQANADAFYNRIDFLMLPSRFEGVPLVMLEAIARGIPVIASRRDGMQDLLPNAWTFPSENAAALAETFANARNDWQTTIDPVRKKVVAEMAIETFKENFHRAVVRT